jgi:serine/threonine protein phosphatase 1
MAMIFKHLLSPRSKRETMQPTVPEGQRLYAIGDIHGRLDLLDNLIEQIGHDNAQRGPAETTRIFLGDLVDRGPDSKGVIERLMEVRRSDPHAVFLKGNHEEIFINAVRGDRRSAALLNRVGGRETVLSYGMSGAEYDNADLGELTKLMAVYVPAAHVHFLDAFEDWHVRGDYLFVHAGIRPGVSLDEQKASDLRWIRREFLDWRESHGRIVVHGHSITTEIDEQPNRIGIDTGAFATGRLTALGIEGADRWYLTSDLR